MQQVHVTAMVFFFGSSNTSKTQEKSMEKTKSPIHAWCPSSIPKDFSAVPAQAFLMTDPQGIQKFTRSDFCKLMAQVTCEARSTLKFGRFGTWKV